MWNRRDRFEDDMREELRFHISRVHRRAAAGRACRTTRRHGRRGWRSATSTPSGTTAGEARGLRLLDNLRRELAYAARLLRKTPGITATALATLALCLGANLTIFAVVQSILLRPLPFPSPDRLMLVLQHLPEGRRARRRLFDYELLRAARPHRGVRVAGRPIATAAASSANRDPPNASG